VRNLSESFYCLIVGFVRSYRVRIQLLGQGLRREIVWSQQQSRIAREFLARPLGNHDSISVALCYLEGPRKGVVPVHHDLLLD
jgi:hypothetical protein